MKSNNLHLANNHIPLKGTRQVNIFLTYVNLNLKYPLNNLPIDVPLKQLVATAEGILDNKYRVQFMRSGNSSLLFPVDSKKPISHFLQGAQEIDGAIPVAVYCDFDPH